VREKEGIASKIKKSPTLNKEYTEGEINRNRDKKTVRKRDTIGENRRNGDGGKGKVSSKLVKVGP